MADEFWDVKVESTNSPSNSPPQEFDIKKIKIPNIYEMGNGKFRVYKTIDRRTKYIGTFDTLEEAINARAAFTLDGTLPETKKQKADREAAEVLAYLKRQREVQQSQTTKEQ